MSQLFICDKETGRILRSITCPDSMDDFQHSIGEIAIAQTPGVLQETHYYSIEGFVRLPEKPSEFHKWDWVSKIWVQDIGAAELSVRTTRDQLISSTDWTQLPDIPSETRIAWMPYRQALRDVTDQIGFPFEILWPTAPQ